jgi:ADP-ribosylglycohydrolase
MALHKQFLVHASPPVKTRQSLLAVATADALGGPAEFRTRFSFPLRLSKIMSVFKYTQIISEYYEYNML